LQVPQGCHDEAEIDSLKGQGGEGLCHGSMHSRAQQVGSTTLTARLEDASRPDVGNGVLLSIFRRLDALQRRGKACELTQAARAVAFGVPCDERGQRCTLP
jgi:hypothetical protein